MWKNQGWGGYFSLKEIETFTWSTLWPLQATKCEETTFLWKRWKTGHLGMHQTQLIVNFAGRYFYLKELEMASKKFRLLQRLPIKGRNFSVKKCEHQNSRPFFPRKSPRARRVDLWRDVDVFLRNCSTQVDLSEKKCIEMRTDRSHRRSIKFFHSHPLEKRRFAPLQDLNCIANANSGEA